LKDPLRSLEPEMHKMVDQFMSEYEEYDLDEVLVGAMTQAVSYVPSFWGCIRSTQFGWQLGIVFREWQPLAESDTLLAILRPWRKAFRFSDPDSVNEDATLLQIYGNGEDIASNSDRRARSR
jgi:hypothetical protein